MNETTIPAEMPAIAPVQEPSQWKGCTLDELRQRRAISLVKREVGKERINHVLNGMRTRVADNGVRGLLFNNNAISGLKKADYLLLGLRVTRALWNWRKKRRR